MTRYQEELKRALTGGPATPLVFVCNFEVEEKWAVGHVGLPGPAPAASAVVRRMEDLGALLAGPDDFLVLSEPLDPDYRAYAEGLGFRLPTVLLADDPALPDRLADVARAGGRLLPMGVSEQEQALARSAGLPLAVPDADVFERVNSKIYSRTITAETGLREVPGHSCTSVGEFADVLASYQLSRENRVVVKDAYGVSGKGLVILDSAARAAGLLRMVRRRAERTGDERLHVVVEEWVPKRFDLNYQLTISADGATTFDFVKQALTERGVHKGHVMPAELEPGHIEELRHATGVIGARLYADGFTGVAGIDAILGADGTLYPVLEINARLNMSTYQGAVTEVYRRPFALAKHYTLRLTAACEFVDVHKAVQPFDDLVITCFGTVNANAAVEPPFEGRLYVMLFADSRDGLTALDTEVTAALERLPHCLEVR